MGWFTSRQKKSLPSDRHRSDVDKERRRARSSSRNRGHSYNGSRSHGNSGQQSKKQVRFAHPLESHDEPIKESRQPKRRVSGPTSQTSHRDNAGKQPEPRAANREEDYRQRNVIPERPAVSPRRQPVRSLAQMVPRTSLHQRSSSATALADGEEGRRRARDHDEAQQIDYWQPGYFL